MEKQYVIIKTNIIISVQVLKSFNEIIQDFRLQRRVIVLENYTVLRCYTLIDFCKVLYTESMLFTTAELVK